MQKMLAVVTVAVLVSVVPETSRAQAWFAFAGGGAAYAMGHLSDVGTKTGGMGFAGVDYALGALPGAAVGVTFIYAHLPYKGTSGDATNIPSGSLEAVYDFGAASGAKIQPYIRAGVGVLQNRYDSGNSSNLSHTQTKLAGSAGVGLSLNLQPVSPFVGVHFVTGGSDTEYYAIYGGVSFPLGGEH